VGPLSPTTGLDVAGSHGLGQAAWANGPGQALYSGCAQLLDRAEVGLFVAAGELGWEQARTQGISTEVYPAPLTPPIPNCCSLPPVN
jgi:hypothetical protein